MWLIGNGNTIQLSLECVVDDDHGES